MRALCTRSVTHETPAYRIALRNRSGWFSSEYIISTNDGQMITTDSKPKLDPDSGMYIFKDAEGREQAIPSASVKQVMER